MLRSRGVAAGRVAAQAAQARGAVRAQAQAPVVRYAISTSHFAGSGSADGSVR